MAKTKIEIYSGSILKETTVVKSNYTIADNYTLIAYSGGTATTTTVGSGGKMEISGGTANTTYIQNQGSMTVNSGTVKNIQVRPGGTLTLNGRASKIQVQSGGAVTVNAGGTGDEVSLYINGTITVNTGGAITNSAQRNGTVTLAGGNASHVTVSSGTFTVGGGSLASDIYQENYGSTLSVLAGGTLTDSTCEGAAVLVASGGTARNSTVSGYTEEGESGTQLRIGSITLKSGAVHSGTLSIGTWGSVIAEAGSVIDFTLYGCTPGNSALIDNFAGISGTPGYTLTVSANQATGSYALADYVDSFSSTISVQNAAGSTIGSVSIDQALVTPDYSYTLALLDETLSLTIADSPAKPYDLAGNANGVSWQSSADAFLFQYSQNNFATVLEVQTTSRQVDTYAVPAGTYQWRVKNTDGSRWSEGSQITAEYVPGDATAWQAQTATADNLFFANACGTWTSAYSAQHVGSRSDWDGTGEWVNLATRNRFADTFTGLGDANILVLTDDANGDALFVDDVYTAFPDDPQSRIAGLSEIRAGAGNDIVDMTSQAFEYTGDGVTMRGGDGNDTLWANKGSNLLFGDAGDDRIIGASGSDVLAGGSGNDVLSGGGGNDVFCFCEDWGYDVIDQQNSGTLTLWFAQMTSLSFNASGSDTLITSGDNSILVKNRTVTEDDCRFGGSGYETEFARLTAAGAFLAESSTKIFAEVNA